MTKSPEPQFQKRILELNSVITQYETKFPRRLKMLSDTKKLVAELEKKNANYLSTAKAQIWRMKSVLHQASKNKPRKKNAK